MRVLITGGAGFLGSHLAENMVADGYEVYIIDNFTTGRKDNVPDGIVQPLFNFDISDLPLLTAVFMKVSPDVVIHAAASYKDPTDWSTDARTNAVGTANVCRLSKEVVVKRLIYFQTSLCYGLNPEDVPLTTESRVNPQGTTYAITKTTGEQIIMMAGIPYVSFRLANVCGPRNLSGPVPTFYQRIKQGKKCFVMNTRRDFIFAKDLVKVVRRAVDGDGKDNNVYHISTGRDYSIQEMYDTVYEAMGQPTAEVPEIRQPNPDDTLTLLIDPSKTEQDFPGWKADTLLQDGIKEAVAWYQTHEFGETYTHLKNVKE